MVSSEHRRLSVTVWWRKWSEGHSQEHDGRREKIRRAMPWKGLKAKGKKLVLKMGLHWEPME